MTVIADGMDVESAAQPGATALADEVPEPNWRYLVANLVAALSYCVGVIDATDDVGPVPDTVHATMAAALAAMGR